MNNFTLFVGDTGPEVALAAKKAYAEATFIDLNNVNKEMIAGYTSLGDLTLDSFVKLLDRATEIYYVEPQTWSHPHTRSRTVFWLKHYSFKKKVHGLDTTFTHPTLVLEDKRKVETAQLWAVGCSFTVGYGLEDINTRWANIVSEKLNLPVSVLAKYGTSIPWAADQILRSNIKSSDVVIWGLTGSCRFPYYKDEQVQHVTVQTYPAIKSIHPIVSDKLLTTDHMIYRAMTSIEQVVADSKKVGYQLVVTQFPLATAPEHELVMLDYLSQFDFFVHNYIDYREGWLDKCVTGHPGPCQHAYYAELFVDHLKKTKDYN
jgi:hypothetical protein